MGTAADNLMDLDPDMDGGNYDDKENLDTAPLPPSRYVPVFIPPRGQPMVEYEQTARKRKDASPLKETKQAQPKKPKSDPAHAASKQLSSPVKKLQPDGKPLISKTEAEQEAEPQPHPLSQPLPKEPVDLGLELHNHFVRAQVVGAPTAASRAQKIIASRRIPKDEEVSAMSTHLRDEIAKQKKSQVLQRVLSNTTERCEKLFARTHYLKYERVKGTGSKQANNTEDEIEALRIEGQLLGTLSFVAQDRLREVEELKAKRAEEKAQRAKEKAQKASGAGGIGE